MKKSSQKISQEKLNQIFKEDFSIENSPNKLFTKESDNFEQNQPKDPFMVAPDLGDSISDDDDDFNLNARQLSSSSEFESGEEADDVFDLDAVKNNIGNYQI